MDHGSRITDHGSWILDHGSWITDHGSLILCHPPPLVPPLVPPLAPFPVPSARLPRDHQRAHGSWILDLVPSAPLSALPRPFCSPPPLSALRLPYTLCPYVPSTPSLQLLKHRFGWVFAEPVDAESLGLPDYHEIISHPMDLGTIRSHLVQSLAATRADGAAEGKVGEEGKGAAAGEADSTAGAAGASDAAAAAAAASQPPHYSHVTEVAGDVRLVFANAMKYNGPGSEVRGGWEGVRLG
ncbi:unnamed protein product [Closterium sp. NIES-53]